MQYDPTPFFFRSLFHLLFGAVYLELYQCILTTSCTLASRSYQLMRIVLLFDGFGRAEQHA